MDFHSGTHDGRLSYSHLATKAQRTPLQNDVFRESEGPAETTAELGDPGDSLDDFLTRQDPSMIQYESSYHDPSTWNEGLTVPAMIPVTNDHLAYSRSPRLPSIASLFNSGNLAPIESPPVSPSALPANPATYRPRRPKSGIPYRLFSSRRLSGAGMAAAASTAVGYSYRDSVPEKTTRYSHDSIGGTLSPDLHSDTSVPSKNSLGPDGLSQSSDHLTQHASASAGSDADIKAIISPSRAPVASSTTDLPLTGGLIAPLEHERLVEPVVLTDTTGILWMDFEYKLKKKRWRYRVRISNLEADIPENALSTDFKRQNCIYPHAMVPKQDYIGHRQNYEMTCNDLGWRLSYLNPSIQNQRGLIQRAVDSYRNSSSDPSVRSRRARKLLSKGGKQNF